MLCITVPHLHTTSTVNSQVSLQAQATIHWQGKPQHVCAATCLVPHSTPRSPTRDHVQVGAQCFSQWHKHPRAVLKNPEPTSNVRPAEDQYQSVQRYAQCNSRPTMMPRAICNFQPTACNHGNQLCQAHYCCCALWPNCPTHST